LRAVAPVIVLAVVVPVCASAQEFAVPWPGIGFVVAGSVLYASPTTQAAGAALVKYGSSYTAFYYAYKGTIPTVHYEAYKLVSSARDLGPNVVNGIAEGLAIQMAATLIPELQVLEQAYEQATNFNPSEYTTALLIATALEVGVKKYSNPVDAVAYLTDATLKILLNWNELQVDLQPAVMDALESTPIGLPMLVYSDMVQESKPSWLWALLYPTPLYDLYWTYDDLGDLYTDTECVTYGLSLATASDPLTVFDQSLEEAMEKLYSDLVNELGSKLVEIGVLTEQDLSTLQTEGATSFADAMVNLANQLIPPDLVRLYGVFMVGLGLYKGYQDMEQLKDELTAWDLLAYDLHVNVPMLPWVNPRRVYDEALVYLRDPLKPLGGLSELVKGMASALGVNLGSLALPS